jgi:hypothetical protein
MRLLVSADMYAYMFGHDSNVLQICAIILTVCLDATEVHEFAVTVVIQFIRPAC